MAQHQMDGKRRTVRPGQGATGRRLPAQENTLSLQCEFVPRVDAQHATTTTRHLLATLISRYLVAMSLQEQGGPG